VTITNPREKLKMNSDQLQGKWKQVKGAVKEKWGKLTDDDIDVIDGKSDQLVGKIQERYGIARDVAQKQVDEWDQMDRETNRELDREAEMAQKRKAS
jgi:uncharacterized protein YjbJ (UPF0337 family)